VPGLIDQEFLGTVLVGVMGDVMGEASLVGGNRTGGSGSSKGAGVSEVTTALVARLGSMTGADGMPIVASHVGSPEPVVLDEQAGPSYLQQRIVLRMRCTSADEFPPPQELVATGGAGSVSLAWALPASRYDLLRMKVRYATGATPPSSAAAGSAVTIADLATTASVALAAGTYSFAIFAAYSPATGTGEDVYSSQATGTTRASVTVT
jgi:hypothetical protein